MLGLFPFFFPFPICFSSRVQFLLAEGTRDLQHYVNLRIANFVRPLQFRTNVYGVLVSIPFRADCKGRGIRRTIL